MKKFEKLLEQLEDSLLGSVSIPLTAWTVVNGDRVLMLMDALRDSLPSEMLSARHVLREQESVLSEARNQAIHIFQEAQQQQQQLLSEHALMQALEEQAHRIRLQLTQELSILKEEAEQEASTLLEQARADAHQLRSEAQQYASHVLQGMEHRLQDIQDRVRYNQEHLNELHVEAVTIQAQAALANPNAYAPAYASQPHALPQQQSLPVAMQHPPMTQAQRSAGKRRSPRPKLANQQTPMMQAGNHDDHVQEALALLYSNDAKSARKTPRSRRPS